MLITRFVPPNLASSATPGSTYHYLNLIAKKRVEILALVAPQALNHGGGVQLTLF